VLEQYGQRAQTRSDHLRLVLTYLDWKPAPSGREPLKELEQFLLDRAMEHDTPSRLAWLTTPAVEPTATAVLSLAGLALTYLVLPRTPSATQMAEDDVPATV
jgi:hypothetical protein